MRVENTQRWNLAAPFEVATEAAWKQYLQQRDAAERGVDFCSEGMMHIDKKV